MSIYMNSKSIHFLNINKLAKCMKSSLPPFLSREDWRDTSEIDTTFSLSQYIHTYLFVCTCVCILTGGIKHTPEHASVCMSFHECKSSWFSSLLLIVWEKKCLTCQGYFFEGFWPPRKDQLSFTLTRKFWQQKTDDCLCLSQNECIHSVYHQVMIFLLYFFIDYSSKCLISLQNNIVCEIYKAISFALSVSYDAHI